MRTLVIVVFALMLAGCNGDRMKQGMNSHQVQPVRAAALTGIFATRQCQV